MKKFLPILLLFATGFVQAQSEKYIGAMKKNLVLLDSAKSTDDLQQCANNFERIAKAEEDQWHPYYYAAYSLVMKAFYSQDKLAIDPICNKADEMIAFAESLSQANSEITTLKAMALTARISVDGSRGMTMGPKATMILEEAKAQKPLNNPRALMQIAQMRYYTPEAFGGGKASGIEVLKKAIAAYQEFKPENELDPVWGKPYAEKMLTDWSK